MLASMKITTSVFLGLLLLLTFSSVPANTPEEARKVAAAGAPGLALSIIDRKQPSFARRPSLWLRFERERLDILFHAERLPEVLERTQGLPERAPVDFVQQAQLRRAQAFLLLQQPNDALQIARDFFWSVAMRDLIDRLPEWRRLVIQSYLQLDQLNDARIALRRFYQDFGDGEDQDRLLRARVLLKAQEYTQVPRVLASLTSPEARAMNAYARLRSGELSPREVWNQLLQDYKADGVTNADVFRYWSVAAAAAAQADDPLREAWFIEQAVLLDAEESKRDALSPIHGERLWAAYEQAGLRLGNQASLLLGDDAQWLNQAALQEEQNKALEARALYAALIKNSVTPRLREEAHRRLSSNVLKEENALLLLAAVYTDSGRFSDYGQLLPEIRHALTEKALRDGEFTEASRLMDGLSEAPDNIDPFIWQLRRARVHVLGGQEDAGIDVMYRMLSGLPRVAPQQADQLLQVMFDLQTVKRHQDAINLFVALLPRITDAQQQRELYFWQADSYKALGFYDQAAYLYLKSAIVHNPKAYDPWAQTARFHAAEALTEAGLIDDARAIYEDLMSITDDASRRSALNRKLQELRLKE